MQEQRGKTQVRPGGAVRILGMMLAAVLALGVTRVRAETTTRTEQRDGQDFMVLENAAAQVVVQPAAGGAIVSYLDRASGVDYVAKPVKPGRVAYGWKDVTSLHSMDPSTKWFGAQPYECRFAQVDGKQAIIAVCERSPVRIERTMALDNETAELTVTIVTTNVGAERTTIWPRWHPYSRLGDDKALHSVVIAPEGPDDGNAAGFRKIFVGQGWDQSFTVKHGFWLAADYRRESGLWMTFDKHEVPVISTWNDYKFSLHPQRASVVLELLPLEMSLAPGASTRQRLSYIPFTQADDPDKMSLGVLADEAERAAARTFLKRIKPNLHIVGPYTMQPQPISGGSVEDQNRFAFNHRRRDRAGYADWGFADGMMEVGADQNQPVRMRHFVGFFDTVTAPVNVEFRLTVTNALGERAFTQRWNYALNPFIAPQASFRKDAVLESVPDGWHQVELAVYAGSDKQPLHRVVEHRKFIGHALPQAAAARAAAGRAAWINQEPAVVTYLRTLELPAVTERTAKVPVVVEEAGGLARQNWPVCVGVPLAAGVLARDAQVVLLDPQQKPIPVQTAVQGTWRDGSVKWLQINFAADVPADSYVTYHLQLNAPAGTPAGANLASEKDGQIVINTGAGTWTSQQLLDLFGADGLWWTNSHGQRSLFQVKGDNAGVALESNGAQRAVIKVTGWYTHPDRQRPVALGELRFEFHRGQPWFELHHSVTFTGEPWTENLGSYGATLKLPGSGYTTSAIDLDGQAVEKPGPLLLDQYNEDLALLKQGDKLLVRGAKSIGVVRMTGSSNATVYLRNAWELHPKRLETNPAAGVVTLHYWPAFAGDQVLTPREDGWLPSSTTMQHLGVGMSRTMHIVIDPTGQLEVAQANAWREPVLAIIPPRYVCATDALLHLRPYDPQVLPQVEHAIAEAFESYELNRQLHGWYGQWVWGALPNTYLVDQKRWANYGRYAWILNEQDIVHAPWLAYWRSGDRRYYHFALRNSRQLMEVSTIRHTWISPESLGMSRRHHECLWLGAGDFGHSMLDPFLEDFHATGYQPSWEAAVRMAHGMSEQRAGTWRYVSNPIAGLSRMYLETQDPFYLQHAKRIWVDVAYPDRADWWVLDHGSRMALYFSQVDADFHKQWAEMALREGAQARFPHLDTQARLYQQTRDPRYAQLGAQTMEKLLREYLGAAAEPLRWSTPTITQHVLAGVRELMYADPAFANKDGGVKADTQPASPDAGMSD